MLHTSSYYMHVYKSDNWLSPTHSLTQYNTSPHACSLMSSPCPQTKQEVRQLRKVTLDKVKDLKNSISEDDVRQCTKEVQCVYDQCICAQCVYSVQWVYSAQWVMSDETRVSECSVGEYWCLAAMAASLPPWPCLALLFNLVWWRQADI